MVEAYEQYCIDQAEAWLSKVRRTVGYSKRLEESAAIVMARADNLKAMRYDEVRVKSSPTPDAIPNAIILAEEMGVTLSEIAGESRERVLQAARALSRMDDANEATCLQLYYVDAVRTWEMVCVNMNYSYDGMMKLRRRALLHAYEVMPHSEREPIHPAI